MHYEEDGERKNTLNLLVNHSAKRAVKDKRDRARLISNLSDSSLLTSKLRKGGKPYLNLGSAPEREVEEGKGKGVEMTGIMRLHTRT